jgi:hypothetical protein
MTDHIHSTREAWLNHAVLLTRQHLTDTAGVTVPQTIRVSCGFPGGGSARTRIGECWSDQASKDGQTEMFISPVLDNTLDVLAVLVHEAIHAAVGTKAGHKGPFKRAAKLAGLEGKMTATHAGEGLKAKLATWLTELGAYPHGALSLTGRKKQGTRLVKCACPICGYTIRTTQKWLEFSGPPICSNNNVVMEVV